MRRIPALVAFVCLSTLAIPVRANVEYVACWFEESADEWSGRMHTTTKCRLAGGDVVEYRRGTDIPVILNPNLGVDNDGVCWFLTSMSTSYVIVDQAANGDAAIAIDPPTGGNTSLIPLGYFRRCSSEPRVEVWEEGRIWEYLASYLHPPPTPEMSPRTGLGVTGVATFAGVALPDSHFASIGDPGSSLELEIRVTAVVVDWGDDTVVTYPPSRVVFSGYPGGGAWHLYSIKNEATTVTVSYLWGVRWRGGGGPWQTLNVPPTTTVIGYPVSEIVSVLGR